MTAKTGSSVAVVGVYYEGACCKGACRKGAYCKGTCHKGAYCKGACRKESGISGRVGIRGKVGIGSKTGIKASFSKDRASPIVYSGGVGKWASFY